MIILWADSRWRDSFGLALLSCELDRLGLDNIVADFQIMPQVMEAMGNHISATILNHTIGSRNKNIIRQARKGGGKVYVMPTEGKVTPENERWFVKNQSGHDRFFTWTERLAPPKTAVTGSPRFQIYTNYQELLDSRDTVLDKYRIPKDRRNTVFVSGFPQAKFTYRNASFLLRDWKDLGRFGAEESAKESMAKLVDFANLIPEFDEDNLIIRPHPMEDLGWWEQKQGELFAQLGIKTHLISQEYIFNILQIADTWVVNNNCTTILENRLVGKAGLLVVNGKDYENETEWADDVVTNKNSARMIANIIKEDVKETKNLPLDRYLQLTRLLKIHNKFVFPSPNDTHVGKFVPMSVISGWKNKIKSSEEFNK